MSPADGLMSPVIGALAYELAARLRPGREVLERYGVSITDFKRLMGTPAFQDMLRRAKQEFGSLASTPDRVRVKAQLLTEIGLDEVWRIVSNTGQPAAARVSAYNSIKSLTGMDRPEEAKPLQRFSLKIVMPVLSSVGDPPVMTIQAEMPCAEKDPESKELAA
jgi:hypothetical protein